MLFSLSLSIRLQKQNRKHEKTCEVRLTYSVVYIICHINMFFKNLYEKNTIYNNTMDWKYFSGNWFLLNSLDAITKYNAWIIWKTLLRTPWMIIERTYFPHNNCFHKKNDVCFNLSTLCCETTNQTTWDFSVGDFQELETFLLVISKNWKGFSWWFLKFVFA